MLIIAVLAQVIVAAPSAPIDTVHRDSTRLAAPVAVEHPIGPTWESAASPRAESWSFGDSLLQVTPVDTTKRLKAIEYDGGYATRLKIHQIASYATVPLFVAEYFTGDALLSADNAGRPKPAFANAVHPPIAAALLGLFAVNTVTGLWNLQASKHDPAGRSRRVVHSIIMLVADVGFTATAIEGGSAGRSESARNTHRALALSSIGLTAIGQLMMYIWKN